MYFPLLRGKQFELLALREISPKIAYKSISPIIEPTKADTSQILKAIQVMNTYSLNFTIILNSCVISKGVTDCMQNISRMIKNDLLGITNFQIGLNITQERDFDELYKFIEIQELQDYNFTLLHVNKLEELNKVQEFISSYKVRYNVLHTEKVKARYNRNFDKATLVSLNDAVNQRQRNSDYIKTPDEFFSEEFAFYEQDGYIGFADYLTIGEQFSDSGFTPYVIAIHLTYLKNQKIRIAHFTSASNTDTNSPLDLPKKFKEALDDLIKFVDDQKIPATKAIEEFRILNHKSHYPGLGTIKKLSIMNHLELVSKLI
jgi:hypothetical protein